jgi:hypothetical protein
MDKADLSPLSLAMMAMPTGDAASVAAVFTALAILGGTPGAIEATADQVCRMIAGNAANTGWASVQGAHGATNPKPPKHIRRAAALA